MMNNAGVLPARRTPGTQVESVRKPRPPNKSHSARFGLLDSVSMTDVHALFWSHLGILTSQRARAMLEVFTTYAEARKYIGEEMLAGMGCKPDTIRKALLLAEEFDDAAARRRLEQSAVLFLTEQDDAYPARLRTIADPPPFLYARGDTRLLDQPMIAVVGTRDMTAYGQRVTQTFVARFVQAGLVPVSGLALGVDGEVALETLRAGGRTVAVLGGGLDVITPVSHRPLAEKIVNNGGLLLSEYPLSQDPTNYSFPGRNRIIAALGIATVVIEAPEKSGALITADFALENGSDVFAVPGDVFSETSAGCNSIIAKGQAKLAYSADEILSDLRIVPPTATLAPPPEDPDQAAVWGSLTSLPLQFDDIVAKAKLSTERANAALTILELGGRVRNMGAGQWVKA